MKPILCNTQVVKNIMSGVQTQDRRPMRKQPPNCYADGKPLIKPFLYRGEMPNNIYHYWTTDLRHGHGIRFTAKAPHQVGDILYVRETCLWKSECGKYYARQTGPLKTDMEVFTVDGKKHWVCLADEENLPAHCVVGWGNKSTSGPRGGNKRYAFDLSFVDNPPIAPRWEQYEYIKRYEPIFRKRVPSIHMPKWAARIFLEVTGVRYERVQNISEEDAKAEGVTPENAEVNCPGGAYKNGFCGLWESLYPGTWDKNIWVFVTEFKQTDEREVK